MTDMKDKRPNDFLAYQMLQSIAKEITEDRDPEDSNTPEIAFANMIAALTALGRQHVHLEPFAMIGGLECAKAQLLHEYFELMTKQNMEDGC